MNQSNLEQKYGTCIECKQINTGQNWCQTCNSKRFQQNFNNWTSGNDDVDKFIQNNQLSARNKFQLLQWIPYDRLYEVKYVAKGGFGKIYKAKWKDDRISHWDVNIHKWRMVKPDKHVVLKVLDNSQKLTLEFISEITSYVELMEYELTKQLIGCYGISQDPNTKEYIMVVANARNLQNCMSGIRYDKSKSNEFIYCLKLHHQITTLLNIVTGLEKIHEKGLIHRNLHIGNIVIFKKKKGCITDIGLCKPANYKELENTENRVYGVLPYIAPEILRGQPYTTESDIYSFGIIMYEVISQTPPYHDIEHNECLASKICEGLRPRFNIKMPPLILHLIKSCLDANPSNRPNAKNISSIFDEWLYDLRKYRKKKPELIKTELIKQIGESEIINNSPTFNNVLSTHPGAIYTSRLLKFDNLPEPKNSDDYYEMYDNISSVEYLVNV